MIDLHAHVVLEDTLGAVGRDGPVLTDDPDCPTFTVGRYTLEGVRYRQSPFMDVELRLEQMASLGITHQVLSPNPLTYLQRAESSVATRYARVHNDALAEVVAAQSALSGLAQLPLQDPAAAVGVLGEAVDGGLVGAAVGTNYGIELDATEFDDLWAEAAALDVPVFIHPTASAVDSPHHDPRLARFDADLWLTFAMEEALAVATLVFGGVIERHPDTRFCISHGGGALIAVIGKMRAAAGRPWSPDHIDGPDSVEESVKRLWFDAHMSDARIRDGFKRLVGSDRLVGGTNFAGWDQPGELPDAATVEMLDANTLTLMGPRFAPGS